MHESKSCFELNTVHCDRLNVKFTLCIIHENNDLENYIIYI